jgi:NTP pyrophosphatase (non-canonical NTP hydrolase)
MSMGMDDSPEGDARRLAERNSWGGALTYSAMREIAASYTKARAKHAPMRGPHEGYAILLEEVDELWDEIKKWQPDAPNREAMRKEALHVAAMALAFLLEVTPS